MSDSTSPDHDSDEPDRRLIPPSHADEEPSGDTDDASDAIPAKSSDLEPIPNPDLSNGNNPPPSSVDKRQSSDRWSRRNVVLAGLGLFVAGLGGATAWYYSARSDERAKHTEERDRERHNWELPPTAGDGIRILEAYAGEYVPLWPQAFVSSEILGQGDFPPAADRGTIYNMIFDRGGSWYGKMSVDIIIESLRRTVVIKGARVEVHSLGTPPNASILVPSGIGGGEDDESDILHTGINLDAPRPILRNLSPDMHRASTLEEQARVRNDPIMLMGPFPGKDFTLGPHEVRRMRVLAEARNGYYEWAISLEIIADGEAQVIPVKVTNYPLRITAPATSYQVPLHETGDSSDAAIGFVRVVDMEELRRWI